MIHDMKYFSFLLLFIFLFISCNDMYDNIKEYADKEIVYPGRFDQPTGKIGFERVEIDLLNAGRIPSSEIKLGKASKTHIEYGNQTLIIDSVCSWINITGLTEVNIYNFVICSMDDCGNKSVPVEISLVPYTREDLNTLILLPPSITESESGAIVAWKNALSSSLFAFYSYTYQYTDKDNQTHTGGEKSDKPQILLENVNKGEPVTLTMNCRIVPRVNNELILDTLDWKRQFDIVF